MQAIPTHRSTQLGHEDTANSKTRYKRLQSASSPPANAPTDAYAIAAPAPPPTAAPAQTANATPTVALTANSTLLHSTLLRLSVRRAGDATSATAAHLSRELACASSRHELLTCARPPPLAMPMAMLQKIDQKGRNLWPNFQENEGTHRRLRSDGSEIDIHPMPKTPAPMTRWSTRLSRNPIIAAAGSLLYGFVLRFRNTKLRTGQRKAAMRLRGGGCGPIETNPTYADPRRAAYPPLRSASAIVATDEKKRSRINWHVSPRQHQKEMHAAHGNTTPLVPAGAPPTIVWIAAAQQPDGQVAMVPLMLAPLATSTTTPPSSSNQPSASSSQNENDNSTRADRNGELAQITLNDWLAQQGYQNLTLITIDPCNNQPPEANTVNNTPPSDASSDAEKDISTNARDQETPNCPNPQCPPGAQFKNTNGFHTLGDGSQIRRCRYCCLTCGKVFAQTHTDAVRQGHPRAAQWCKPPRKTAGTQQNEQQQADTATAPAHCIGDLVIQGHNEQGTSTMQHGTHRLKQIMSRTHIQMMQETNYKPASQTAFMQLVDCAKSHIMLSHCSSGDGPHDNVGKGVAIVIARSILTGTNAPPKIYDDTGYQCPDKGRLCDGKFIAVYAEIRDTPTVLISMHAPHTIESRTIFFDWHRERLELAIQACMATHKLQKRPAIIAQGDINLLQDPYLDLTNTPAHQEPPNSPATSDHAALKHLLDQIAPEGTIDAYRALHPDTRAATRIDNKGVGRRLDALFLSRIFTTERGELAKAYHVPRLDYTYADPNSGKEKIPDHDGIEAIIRPQTQPIAPKRWSMDQASIRDPAVRERITEIMKTPREDSRTAIEHLAQIEKVACKEIKMHTSSLKRAARKRLTQARAKVEAGEARLRTLDIEQHTSVRQACKEKLTRNRRQLAKELAMQQRAHDAKCSTDSSESARAKQLKTAGAKIGGEPILAIEHTTTDATGETKTEITTDQKTIQKATTDYWAKYLNNNDYDYEAHGEERSEVLDAIQADPTCQLPQMCQRALSIEAITDLDNIKEAILAQHKNSSPGKDGKASEFYQQHIDDIAPILREAYREMLRDGKLTEDKTTGVLTPAFKNKGHRHDKAAYRPITVTTVKYRILARASRRD